MDNKQKLEQSLIALLTEVDVSIVADIRNKVAAAIHESIVDVCHRMLKLSEQCEEFGEEKVKAIRKILLDNLIEELKPE